MSAKKYLTTTMLAIFASLSSIYAQEELAANSEDSFEEQPQFLVRTEQNGKVKYVECAMQNLYFHKATAATPKDTIHQPESEFTAKGGIETSDEYFAYAFFLVQDGVIKACNNSGTFDDQPDGLYKLSRFSYPISISPESFEGKEFNTVNNHPLFEKDPSLYNMTIRLFTPEKPEPVLSTELAELPEINILGQVLIANPANN